MTDAALGRRLSVRAVTVAFDGRTVLDRVSLDVAAGSIVAVQGPSGSGKSTLLAVIAGLLAPQAGTVALDDVDVTNTPVHRRGIAMVFQRPALFEHLDVAGNIGYGLGLGVGRAHRVDRATRAARVAELLDLIGMAGFEQRSVATLSGGEAQRVALARALAPRPSVLLLDEPLSALDEDLRHQLAVDLVAILAAERCTTIHVTHDRGEAATIADRVVELAELGPHRTH
jgi:thiamine transport system ATP-binding protein